MSDRFQSAFTVDVECGISIAMRDYFGVSQPPTDRVVSNTQAILSLLDRHGVKATFFVLGTVARAYPDLVRDIQRAGHETGVHSDLHIELSKLSEREAYEDARVAKDAIEQLTGEAVGGYRAPAFSLVPRTCWMLPVLADLGFCYDSSVVPARAVRHGWPGVPEEIFRVSLPGGASIVECPMSVTRLFGRGIPICGGGYLRILPFWFTRRQFRQISKKRPVILYLHPYEVDTARYPDYFQAATAAASLRRQLKLRAFPINKRLVLPRLTSLLASHRFGTLRSTIADVERRGPLRVCPMPAIRG